MSEEKFSSMGYFGEGCPSVRCLLAHSVFCKTCFMFVIVRASSRSRAWGLHESQLSSSAIQTQTKSSFLVAAAHARRSGNRPSLVSVCFAQFAKVCRLQNSKPLS